MTDETDDERLGKKTRKKSKMRRWTRRKMGREKVTRSLASMIVGGDQVDDGGGGDEDGGM